MAHVLIIRSLWHQDKSIDYWVKTYNSNHFFENISMFQRLEPYTTNHMYMKDLVRKTFRWCTYCVFHQVSLDFFAFFILTKLKLSFGDVIWFLSHSQSWSCQIEEIYSKSTKYVAIAYPSSFF